MYICIIYVASYIVYNYIYICSYIVGLYCRPEWCRVIPPIFFFLFKIVLSILCLILSYINFGISLSMYKKTCWDFDHVK